jgi:hypothetical protein
MNIENQATQEEKKEWLKQILKDIIENNEKLAQSPV